MSDALEAIVYGALHDALAKEHPSLARSLDDAIRLGGTERAIMARVNKVAHGRKSLLPDLVRSYVHVEIAKLKGKS